MLFVVEKKVPLGLAKAWEVFSNTDHFNRFVPLPRVLYAPIDAQAPAADRVLRQASARQMGMKLAWTEYPFEWVEHQAFSVTRIYQSGPVKKVVAGTVFTAVSANETTLCFYADVTPRWQILRPLLGLIVTQTLRAFRTYVDVYLEHVRRGDEHLLPSRKASQANEQRLTAALALLRSRYPVSEALASRLAQHLREGGDDEVRRMRPFVLADVWGLDRYATLEFFLYATRAGMLTLDWELMCPNCRVPKAEASTFKQITSSYHCDLCGIDYSTDLDRYTELRFNVDPSIREAENAVYCIGSPAKTPHVLAQRYLKPGERTLVRLGPDAADLRLRTVGPNDEARISAGPDGDPEFGAAYDGETWTVNKPSYRGGGDVQIELRNEGPAASLVVVERQRWDDRAVTASLVTSLQKFRDLFSSEVLAPGQQIGVRNLCVLFTDLKRSTELYEQVGDAAAFARVIRHFDYVSEHVSRERGTVVKTIGDAVMAIFPSPVAAVRATVAIQEELWKFNEEQHFDPPLVLKLGVHYGPAIAVNANNVLDYFGRTVNFAARVQAESQGGDIVLSDAVATNEEVACLLRSQPLELTGYSVRLKGFEEEVKLWKLLPETRLRRTA